MQHTQLVKHSLSMIFAGLALLASSLLVSADSVAHNAPLTWSAIYSRVQGEVWYPPAAVSKKDGGPGGPTICTMDTAGTDGNSIVNPAWSHTYTAQGKQAAFRVCGLFSGQGQVLLTYAGAGEPTDFDYSTPTSLCLDTYANSDGSPRALDLYLVQLGTDTASIASPSILVSEQP